MPILTDTLTTPGGVAVNLTGATVNLVMRAFTTNVAAVNAAATIVAPTLGTISYTFTVNDSAVADQFMANWHVTFAGGATMDFPTDGYFEVAVEEDLATAGGPRLVGVGELKDHLKIVGSDRSHDMRLARMIDEVAPVIENITGPILQRNIDEWYDGGGTRIELRYGPVVSFAAVTEYRGPVAYPLTQVVTPDLGTIYSYMWEQPRAIVRRTVGGGMTSFPAGNSAVHVVYTAGFAKVPANVRGATLELIRVNYQQTEQGGRPGFGSGGASGSDDMRGTPLLGFFIPNRVREMLLPNKRAPSVA